MLTWTTTSSPLGELMLMATEKGIVRVAFEREGFGAVRERVAGALGAGLVEDARPFAEAESQLDGYWSAGRRGFDLPLDWSLTSGFHGEVERLLPSIPYGETLTYSRLAALAGRPKAHRAAASACARNPLPIIVPCHRVTRRDGGLGGYLGGIDAKRFLLDLEKATTR